MLFVLSGRYPLLAQFTAGSVTGIVRDKAGAPVASVPVTAVQVETGLTRNETTKNDGIYSLADLPVGDYDISVSAQSFSTQKTRVTVTAGHISRWDPMLAPGETTQVVDVSATAANLETESHQLADTMSSSQIENLPANGRDVFATLTTQTNVAPYTGSGNSRSDINFYGVTANSLTIGGNAWGMASFLEDGVTNFNLLTKTANIQPSIESVQEVTIVRNGAHARYDEPNVVNVVTKGGSNAFHGRLYDYLRNDALNTFVKNNTTKAQLRYNQFGGNVGGPVIRDRLFFFFDYSGQRQSSQSILNANVPTALERSGDFSQSGVTIYDPTTYDSRTKTIKQFSNNKIDPSRISDFAKRFLAYMPLPTGSPIPGNNFYSTGAATTNYDLYLGRVDYNLSSKDLIYGAYSRSNPADFSPSWGLEGIFNTLYTRDAKNAYVEEIHTFSPHVVNTGRVGYNYSNILVKISGNGRENYSQEFGLTALSPAPQQWAPPIVYLNSHSSLGNATAPEGSTQDLYQYADELSWVHGRHTTVFGFQLDRVQFNANWTVYNNGLFRFSGIYTNNHAANPTGGEDIADFLLGLPYNAEGAVGATVGAFRQYNFTPYVQGDWRVSDKLTLNLGLRYDYYESPADVHNNSHVYDVATNTTHTGTFHQNYLNVAPRLGFAYAVLPDTTVRGGYGVYYALPLYNNYQFLLSNAPNYFLQNNTYTNTQLVPTYATFVSNPSGSTQAPFTTALNMPTPYVQQWNLAAQHAFSSKLMGEVTYLGSKSTHLQIRHNPNQTALSDPANPTPIAARRPYSWVGEVLEAADLGSGGYNGLELSMQGHYASGASFNASYVYSKALDILTTEELYPEAGLDLARDWGLADFNQKHVAKVSGVYPLPFGRGRRWLNANRFMEETVGGWNVSGFLVMNGGMPFYVSATDNSNTGSYHAMRANQICDPTLKNPSVKMFFNTACFVQPGTYQLGNERRNNLIGPHNTDTNLSVMKNFPAFREQFLQFRVDFFHAFNHPLWSQPNASTTATNNGQVTSFGGSRAIQGSLKYSF
ncbi:TonB-dependent receptor [Granulicella sp. dw_53]|uniref:TonB-dependent receptor domain-containing protein n=1 Tax=Granulicella sp. dw_53 TaxID=2719792 RepID=UPI001BD4D1DD|nr:TonB-dependent receptor [Granulicella sp. dw_53]